MHQRYDARWRRTGGVTGAMVSVVAQSMQDAPVGTPARFRPTVRQSFGRGLFAGSRTAVAALAVTSAAGLAGLVVPWWLWFGLVTTLPVAGVVVELVVGRRLGTDVDAGGIRTVSAFTRAVQPWSRVVDLRAERRGARTVVSVYLDSGASVRLRAPYDGGLLAGDPQFESKVFALSHLWRSHRIGGLAG
jgi:hypothetical protein